MLIWVIVIILAVWWISKYFHSISASSTNETSVSDKNNRIEEDTVIEIQGKFEKKLHDEINFPDAIRGMDVYIYSNLMRVWYKKLSSENRYNEEMTKKIRNDWVDYISFINDFSTYNYLSFEFYDSKDTTKSDSYSEKTGVAFNKKQAIEDAFASSTGTEAVNELARIRNLDHYSFDKLGNLAPKGFEYDLRGELKPKKK